MLKTTSWKFWESDSLMVESGKSLVELGMKKKHKNLGFFTDNFATSLHSHLFSKNMKLEMGEIYNGCHLY